MNDMERIDRKLAQQKLVMKIYRLRLEGKSRREVIEELSIRLNSSIKLDRFIKKADELIGKEMTEDREKMYHTQLAKRENLYNRVIDKGDYASAIALLKDMAKLMDLYPQYAVERPRKQGELPLVTITDQDRDNARKLLVAIGDGGCGSQGAIEQKTISDGLSADESGKDNDVCGEGTRSVARENFIAVDFS